MQDVDILLHRLSGHPVVKAGIKQIQTSREEVLLTPDYTVALGLLLCEQLANRRKPGEVLERN